MRVELTEPGDTDPQANNVKVYPRLLPLFGFVVLLYLGFQGFRDFIYSKEAPIKITGGAYNSDTLQTIVETSRTNELRFDKMYVGKQFWAFGRFKESNFDFRRYHISVAVGSVNVACETNDDRTLAYVSSISVDTHVMISGLIQSTWMGDLILDHCAVTP